MSYRALMRWSMAVSCSPTPMIFSRVSALSRSLASMKRGRSSASTSTNSFNNCCPARRPVGSVTVRVLFLPRRSTTMPLDRVTFRWGGVMAPSRAAAAGRNLSPPSAQAKASSTLVLPWLLLPPTSVSPVGAGVISTALMRFTFSASNAVMVTDISSPPSGSRSRCCSAG